MTFHRIEAIKEDGQVHVFMAVEILAEDEQTITARFIDGSEYKFHKFRPEVHALVWKGNLPPA